MRRNEPRLPADRCRATGASPLTAGLERLFYTRTKGVRAFFPARTDWNPEAGRCVCRDLLGPYYEGDSAWTSRVPDSLPRGMLPGTIGGSATLSR